LAVHDVGWRDFFTDPTLAAILAAEFDNNRDLRIAALIIERTRAQYRIQHSERCPSVGMSVSGQRSGGSDAQQSRNVYRVGRASAPSNRTCSVVCTTWARPPSSRCWRRNRRARPSS
jgi:outer membrane protein TolC